MKCYPVSSGYMGLIDGNWILFASESDYREQLHSDYNTQIEDWQD